MNNYESWEYWENVLYVIKVKCKLKCEYKGSQDSTF